MHILHIPDLAAAVFILVLLIVLPINRPLVYLVMRTKASAAAAAAAAAAAVVLTVGVLGQ
jgi:hypothetical protein